MPHVKTFQSIFPDIKIYASILLVNAIVCALILRRLYRTSLYRLPKVTYKIIYVQAFIVGYYVYSGAFYVDILFQLQSILIAVIIGFLVYQENSLERLINTVFIINVMVMIYSLIDFDAGSKMFFIYGGEIGISQGGAKYRFTGIFGPPGIATVYFCVLFNFYWHKVLTEQRNYLIYMFCVVVVCILGFYSFSRAFIVCIAVCGSLALIAGLGEIIRNKAKIVYMGVVVYISIILFGAYVDDVVDIYVSRFEFGVDNRLYGKSGVIDLADSISLKSLFVGSLVYLGKENLIYINHRYFQVDNAYLYYLCAFGVWVAIPIYWLYLSSVKTLAERLLISSGSGVKIVKLQAIIIFGMLLNAMSEVTLLAPINIFMITAILKDGVAKRAWSVSVGAKAV